MRLLGRRVVIGNLAVTMRPDLRGKTAVPSAGPAGAPLPRTVPIVPRTGSVLGFVSSSSYPRSSHVTVYEPNHGVGFQAGGTISSPKSHTARIAW
jgi:hypothetical protein